MKSITRIYSLIFVMTGLFLTSCNSKNNSKKYNEHSEVIQKIKNDKEETIPLKPKITSANFYCGDIEFDKNDIPSTTLYAVFDKDTIEVEKVSGCKTLPRAEYGDYNVPETAAAAVYSYFAGYGDYFYATINNNEAEIYKASNNEMDTLKLQYNVIKKYITNE